MTIRGSMQRGPAEVGYVCMRPEHHRHRAADAELSEHRGCVAYCPAGAVEGHEWMACSTDLDRLAIAGIAPADRMRPGRERTPILT